MVGALSLGLAPTAADRDAAGALTAASAGHVELLVLVGSDPLNDFPDAELARRALAGARRIVAVDTLPTESVKFADVVLAAAAYGEQDGTTTNIEGRVTPVTQKVTPRGTVRPDWMIAVELGRALGVFDDHPLADVLGVHEVTDLITADAAGFGGVTRDALAASRDGVLADVVPAELADTGFSATGRNNYDYRLVVSRKLYDRAVGTSMSRSLANLTPGPAIHLHPLDLDSLGVAEGEDVQVISPHASAVLPVRAHDGVPRGIAWAPFNQGGGKIEDIVPASAPIVDVRIEVL